MTRRTMRLVLGVAAAAALATPVNAAEAGGTTCTEHTPWACVEKILESIL